MDMPQLEHSRVRVVLVPRYVFVDHQEKLACNILFMVMLRIFSPAPGSIWSFQPGWRSQVPQQALGDRKLGQVEYVVTQV